jgi:hypothetical protein
VGSVSWLGRLFGTNKAVENLLDKDNGLLKGVGGWIDDFSYTDEEKAESNRVKRNWATKQLEAIEPFKVVQRVLAAASTFVWITAFLNVVIALWVEAVTDIKIVDKMLEFVLSDFVFWPVLAVYSLYCSGGVVESFKRKK